MSTKKFITLELEISDVNSDGESISKELIEKYTEQVVQNIERFIGDGMLSSDYASVELDSWSVDEYDSLKESVFDVSEKHFKESAKRLRPELKQEGLDVGHSKSLQILSQSLYAKPFEEIKETILNNKKQKNTFENNNNHVALIDLGGEYVLFVNGEFEGATYNGLSTEISYGELFDKAHQFAQINHTQVEEIFININEYFDGEFEYEDLKTLFNIEGFIQSRDWELVFLLENAEIVNINSTPFQYALNGDWRSESIERNSSLDEVKNQTIWTPENSKNEYFLSILELTDAQKISKNQWSVNYLDQKIIIEILK